MLATWIATETELAASRPKRSKVAAAKRCMLISDLKVAEPQSRPTATVESFGRRQASESLRCPNRGGHGLSYGESGFAQVVVLDVAAQNRTHLRADRPDLGRASGRRKADGPILRFRRLLLGSAGASGSTSRRGCALEEEGVGPCRVTAQVPRMRVRTVAAREADSGARRPR